MKINRDRFFPLVKSTLFKKYSQKQVDGINFILDAWEGSRLRDKRWLAYSFGTTFLETDKTMQPISEYGSNSYFTNQYDIRGGRPEVAKRYENTSPGDGIKYRGRGYVQLTWKRNYRVMSEILGIDLVNYPDLAMRPDIAARIMFIGMERGIFTGKAYKDYFTNTKSDWVNARRIINGTDRAQTIANHSIHFYNALRES